MTNGISRFVSDTTTPVPTLWQNLLPYDVAINQAGWERVRSVKRMRLCGLTYEQVGKRIGVCAERARQLDRRPIATESPAMRWANPMSAIIEIAIWSRRHKEPTLVAETYYPVHKEHLGAYAAREWVSGRTQKMIGDRIGTSSASVCIAIAELIEEYVPEAPRYTDGWTSWLPQGEDRKELAAIAFVRWAKKHPDHCLP